MEVDTGFESGLGIINLRKLIIALAIAMLCFSTSVSAAEIVVIRADTTTKTQKEYFRWHVAANVGKSTLGKVPFGKVTRGGPLVFGADFAYFVGPVLGAGLHFNMGVCEIDFGKIIYSESLVNFGPSMYLRFGSKKGLAFLVSAGWSVTYWSWNDSHSFKSKDPNFLKDFRRNDVGFFSLSVNYMITQHFGIGLKLQCIIDSLYKDVRDIERQENYYGYEHQFVRRVDGIAGAGLNVNFRF